MARYGPAIVAEMEDRVHCFVAGLRPHLIDGCTTAALQPGMEISRIQAYAQNLEERKRQRRTERDRDRGHGKRDRSLDIGGASREDRDNNQSSRASSSRNRQESGQMRPPLLRCAQCGKLHAAAALGGTGTTAGWACAAASPVASLGTTEGTGSSTGTLPPAGASPLPAPPPPPHPLATAERVLAIFERVKDN
ncbi:uncharacterized protein LOC132607798 [Lycium barbarum]|uniref:uncharacterized protein LOC132607798 n=1 Tax=Lycium barbarum TaxID=112863 RepID=UPI00293E84D9|nr:uncharacterized protein LOC132607798 [Lycium barbarum]